MNKIIIENLSSLHMLDAIDMVKKVIEHGRVSNNNTQYCYFSNHILGSQRFVVHSDLNAKSDKFTLTNGGWVAKNEDKA